MSANIEETNTSPTPSNATRDTYANLHAATRVLVRVGLIYWVISVLVSWFSPIVIEWSLKQVGAARGAARLANFLATQLQSLSHPLIAGLLFAAAIVCALLARQVR